MSTNPSDEALREQVLVEFRQVLKLAPTDYTENCTNVVMRLIAADREKAELRAHINELEMTIPMRGKTCLDGSIVDTAIFEDGQPNMIDVKILEIRLTNLQAELKRLENK